jgi:Ni,Fe-hydrogenase maturation factor
MPGTLLIACGNPLRGDDGVAHEVLRRVGDGIGRELRFVHQLVPELAEEIAGFARVVFVDADVASVSPVIEAVCVTIAGSPLTHAAIPAEIVALARGLFGFEGEAFVCRIPAHDFSVGQGLSPHERDTADEAAKQLNRFLHKADGTAGTADAEPEHKGSEADHEARRAGDFV